MHVKKNEELEHSKIIIVVEIGEYSLNEIVIHKIMEKTTGSISASSFDKGEEMTDKLTRFDNFIQILEGKAEILINDVSYNLESGQSIIIPANSKNTFKAHERFKMISTIIKSGYE